jgi:hypothetical protein
MALVDHSAAGTSAGIGFQFDRALYWLAQSPAGVTVGIETDDDVTVSAANGPRILEQDKHSIQPKGHPFGDRSKALWNTLATWVAALDAEEIAAQYTKFLMVTNKPVPDCIAKRINRATTPEDAIKCIDELQKAAEDPPEKVASLMASVLLPSSRRSLTSLILACELSDATDVETLRATTISHLQIPESLVEQGNSIVDELLGWIHRSALTAWQAQKACWITRDHFVNQFDAILCRRKRLRQRERSERLIPVTGEDRAKQLSRTFVKQVHLVSEDESVATAAIEAFIRCAIEKLRLSEEGAITDDDWLDFQCALQSRWVSIRDRTKRMGAGKTAEDIGFEILSETTEHRERLAGSETDQVYLTAGMYHRLADLLNLGWHPRYKELLTEKEAVQ